MKKIIAKLRLSRITDAALGEYAQDKIEKINLAPAFAAVVPSTATVQTKTDDYEDALVAAINGTKGATALKDQKREELEELLTAQAIDCAKIASGNLALYLTTGYEAKDTKGKPVGELAAVTGVELSYGNSPAELKLKFNPVKNALNYTVQVYTDISNPSGSSVKELIIKKIGRRKITLTGLPSGQVVFVRVRANGGSTGQGPWSDPAEKRVP